jgi:type II secretory pathway pseudopilin PulG
MKSQSGFTLVEALVTGVIGAIIPIAIISLLRVNNAQLEKNSAQFKLAQTYGVVSEEIYRYANLATTVVQPGPCSPGLEVTGVPQYSGVLFCDQNGQTMHGLKVIASDGFSKLQEWSPGTGWTDFLIGTNPVYLMAYPQGPPQKVDGLFNIYGPNYTPGYPGCFGLRFNLRPYMVVSGVADTLPVQTESVICRNTRHF